MLNAVRRNGLLSLVLMLTVPPVAAQPAAGAADGLQSTVDSIALHWDSVGPGFAVVVVDGGDVVVQAQYGFANLELLTPITAETVFPIASVTKQFVGAAIQRLVAAGSLRLGDDVVTHLPEIHRAYRHVTIQQLLTHTGGLADAQELAILAGRKWHDSYNESDDHRYLDRYGQLLFEPGAEFRYTNSGYELLVRITEAVTGVPFPAWLDREILEPAGMHDTHFHLEYDVPIRNRAHGYRETAAGWRLSPYRRGGAGGGGINSTIADLGKWLKALNRGDVFPVDEVDWQQLPARSMGPSGAARYTFGWVMNTSNGRLLVSHSGRSGSFLSYVGWVPSERVAVAVLTNEFPGDPQLDPSAVGRALLAGTWNRETQTDDGPSPRPAQQPANRPLRSSLSGTYWQLDGNYLRWIDADSGGIWYRRTNGTRSELRRIAPATYMMADAEHVQVRFAEQADSLFMFVRVGDGAEFQHVKVPPFDPDHEQLREYEGVYVHEDLLIAVKIRATGRELFIDHPIHSSQRLRFTVKDRFNIAPPYWSSCNDTGCWLGSSNVFERGEDGRVTGLLLENQTTRVRLRRIGSAVGTSPGIR